MENLTLGQRLKKARLEKNFTQQDVTGNFITRNMLSKIENDIAKPSIKTIEYLAKRLDKPLSYFMESMVEGIDVVQETNATESDNLELMFEHTCYLIKDNELDKCIHYIEETLKDYKSNTINFYLGRLRYNLALCYYSKEMYSIANEKFEQVLKSLSDNRDYYYLSNSYFRLNYINYANGNYNKSEEYCKKALLYLHKSFINDILYEIKLSFSLGFIYKRLKKYSDSINYLNSALQISHKHNCHYNSGEIHMLLGNIYTDINKFEDAIYHAEKAIVFFDFTESYNLKASTQKNLGITLILAKEYDRAIGSLEKALQYFIEISNVKQLNTAKCILLDCLVKKDLYRDAIDYFKEIDLDAIAVSDKGELFTHLGQAYIGINDLANAKKYLLEAEEILTSIDRYDYLSETCNTLAQLYSSTKEYKEAYEYSTKAKEYLEKSIKTGLIYREV